jgi:hypothetical protein
MWNISQGFKAELRKPTHQIAARATLLDSSFREIPDGDFFTAGADDFQDFIVDGNVDVDRDRGTRRTGSVTITNKAGQFTPDNAADYDGKFYVNRNLRLYRGVVMAGGTTLFAPIGTFMIDVIDTIVERNMSVVNMTLSDHWKKFTKSLVTSTKVYASGTHINTIIRDMAAQAGADYPLAPALDPLTGPERTTANTHIPHKMTLERGESRGDRLKELANKFGIDIYFNVEGRLVTNDRKDPKDATEVWHFYSTPSTPEEGMLTTVRRTLSDDNLYNHVFVIGLGDEKKPVVYERKDIDPASVTNIDRIGDRVKILESQTWKTLDEVTTAGKKLWNTHFNLFEEVVCDVVCNPALEADDVVRITEPYFAKLNAVYRIVQMNVPLTTSKQTIRVVRTIVA